MTANWNGDHVCAHPRVAPNGVEYCGCPHAPTMREIADIEREPVFTAPPVDPIAHLRKAVEDNIREPHRKIVMLWIENAFLLGGIDQGKRMLARMDARGAGK